MRATVTCSVYSARENALLLWISWSHYSGSTSKTDLVRFQWKAGSYNWSTRPPAFKIMPKFGITQNVPAKLDPTGTYLVYRISGNGRDRYERRKVTEVESGVNHTYGKGRIVPAQQGESYGDGLDGSLRDAGLRNPR